MIKSVYLAGKMRGMPRYNFDAFEEAMQDLQGRGLEVISPHRMDLDLGFDPSTDITPEFLEGCVRRDIEAIIKTEGVVFLPGWTDSTGAIAEYHVAKWLDRKTLLYPTLSEFV